MNEFKRKANSADLEINLEGYSMPYYQGQVSTHLLMDEIFNVRFLSSGICTLLSSVVFP